MRKIRLPQDAVPQRILATFTMYYTFIPVVEVYGFPLILLVLRHFPLFGIR